MSRGCRFGHPERALRESKDLRAAIRFSSPVWRGPAPRCAGIPNSLLASIGGCRSRAESVNKKSAER